MQIWKNKAQRKALFIGLIIATIAGAVAPARFNPVVIVNGFLNRS